jgi:hypothetical protein
VVVTEAVVKAVVYKVGAEAAERAA